MALAARTSLACRLRRCFLHRLSSITGVVHLRPLDFPLSAVWVQVWSREVAVVVVTVSVTLLGVMFTQVR